MGGLVAGLTSDQSAQGTCDYIPNRNAWKAQARRVRACSSSIEMLRRDVQRLNLVLRAIKSPQSSYILQCRILTTVDAESMWGKWFWNFGYNTMIQICFVPLTEVIPLSPDLAKPYFTPSNPEDRVTDETHLNALENQPFSSVESDDQQIRALSLNEFYYLFLFMDDKLPEFTSWLMTQSSLSAQDLQLRPERAELGEAKSDRVEEQAIIDEKERDEEKEGTLETTDAARKADKEDGDVNDLDFECIICLGPLKDAVCLPCTHEYCRNCITAWHHDSGSDSCPLCRSISAQNEMWVKVDSEDGKQDYIRTLLCFPFEYVQQFPTWGEFIGE